MHIAVKSPFGTQLFGELAAQKFVVAWDGHKHYDAVASLPAADGTATSIRAPLDVQMVRAELAGAPERRPTGGRWDMSSRDIPGTNAASDSALPPARAVAGLPAAGLPAAAAAGGAEAPGAAATDDEEEQEEEEEEEEQEEEK